MSDGFHHPRKNHEGVDVMYMRATLTDSLEWAPRGASGTSWYFMPTGIPVLAAHSGRIWSAEKTRRGWQVIVDHGPQATLYQHLERLTIPARSGGPGGPEIATGQQLGIVGGDPSVPPALRHLHFEVWDGRTPRDPEPLLATWPIVTIAGEAIVVVRPRALTTRRPALL